MPTHLLAQKDRFKIDTDPHRLQIDVIHDYLSNRSYWAKGRSVEVIQKSITNSLCFGVYEEDKLVGFARVVSDFVTFGWLCDVFILESHRGHGLGKWLVETILKHPDITNIRRLLLATRDAHELYRLSGFQELEHPEKLMERPNPAASVPPLE